MEATPIWDQMVRKYGNPLEVDKPEKKAVGSGQRVQPTHKPPRAKRR